MKLLTKLINLLIKKYKLKGISDGYHTFEQLYETRNALAVRLFNEWGNSRSNGIRKPKFGVHKAPYYQNGVGGQYVCDSDYFIAMAEMPNGQISFHLPSELWNSLQVPTKVQCNTFDGHDTNTTNQRLLQQ